MLKNWNLLRAKKDTVSRRQEKHPGIPASYDVVEGITRIWEVFSTTEGIINNRKNINTD